MDRCAGVAARLLWDDRRDLAIQALAARHGVSRKFASFRDQRRCWPASAPLRLTATFWSRTKAGDKFHTLVDPVRLALTQTPRGSSLVENLNSRLRNHFTLRRHLGGSYLSLSRFFLNHRCFMRGQRAERKGKSPRELMTGPHWLTLPGLGPLQPRQA
jgi:hypothetical protein